MIVLEMYKDVWRVYVDDVIEETGTFEECRRYMAAKGYIN